MAELSAAVEEVHDRMKALVSAVHDESVTVCNLRLELERLTATNKLAHRELQTTISLEASLVETLRKNRIACQSLLSKREQLKHDIAMLRQFNFAKMKDVELLRGECCTARFRHEEARKRRLQAEAAADALREKFEQLSVEKDSYSRQAMDLEVCFFSKWFW